MFFIHSYKLFSSSYLSFLKLRREIFSQALSEPALEGDQMSYSVDILDGEMPAGGGASSLFIDTIGRPLSPVSVAGVHRRGRRRGRRRARRRMR